MQICRGVGDGTCPAAREGIPAEVGDCEEASGGGRGVFCGAVFLGMKRVGCDKICCERVVRRERWVVVVCCGKYCVAWV